MGKRITFFPTPLPGEHLLSAVARWVVLTGQKDAKCALITLSANRDSLNPRRAVHPLYSDLFDTLRASINIDELLRQHSLFPYYAPLIKFNQRLWVLNIGRKLAEPMRYSPLHNQLSLASNWRWCPCCVKEDEERYGTAYWHTKHQLPSVLSCYKHEEQILLKECSHCGFNIRDLRLNLLPPNSGNCPQCGAGFESNGVENEVTDWLKKASLQLMSQSDLKNPQYEYSMMYGVSRALGATHFSRPCKSPLLVFEKLQQQFAEWFIAHQLGQFFDESEQNIHSQKILTIESASKYPRSIPPISHLLWLKFLKVPSLEAEAVETFARSHTTDSRALQVLM